MKKISYLAILVIAFIATSCLGSSDSKVELTRTLTSTHNFSVVQRNSDHAQYMVDRGPDYNLEISLTDQTLSLSASNLRYWADQPVTSFKVLDVPFEYDNTNKAIVVNIPSVETDGIKITDLVISYLERTDGEISLPAWDIEYVINEEYHVRAVQDIVALFGKASVSYDGVTYETEEPYYQLFFDPMKLHDNDMVDGYFIMYGAKFADNMPSMNLKFYFSARFTVAGFSINSTDPIKIYTIDGNTETEQPEFELSSFSAGGLFDLRGVNQYPYYFDFTVGNRYMVGLDLGYSVPQSWQRPDEIQ